MQRMTNFAFRNSNKMKRTKLMLPLVAFIALFASALVWARDPQTKSCCGSSCCAANPHPYGRVDTLAIEAQSVKSPIRVNVALPGGYFADTTSRYPVLYLLNGHGGHQNSWGGLIPLDTVATNYNMVIVTLDGRNSWYWDSPLIPDLQMESFITRELLPYIDTNYRTVADRDHRAITGYSMGGHGAYWLAIRHKDLIGNAGSTSGGVDFMPFPNRWDINKTLGDYTACNDRWQSHTVMSQLDRLNPGDLNLIMDCGTEDFFFKVNNTLDSVLTARGIEHTYLTSPGIHNGAYWKKSIYPQLDFFKAQFAK